MKKLIFIPFCLIALVMGVSARAEQLSCRFSWQSEPYQIVIEQDAGNGCDYMVIHDRTSELRVSCDELKAGTLTQKEIMKSEDIRFLLTRSNVRPSNVEELVYYYGPTDDDGGGFFLFDLVLRGAPALKRKVGGITYMGGASGFDCESPVQP